MLQIIIWGMAIGIVLLGLNILQLAWTASLADEKRNNPMTFGIVVAIVSIALAGFLVLTANEQAKAIPTISSASP